MDPSLFVSPPSSVKAWDQFCSSALAGHQHRDRTSLHLPPAPLSRKGLGAVVHRCLPLHSWKQGEDAERSSTGNGSLTHNSWNRGQLQREETRKGHTATLEALGSIYFLLAPKRDQPPLWVQTQHKPSPSIDLLGKRQGLLLPPYPQSSTDKYYIPPTQGPGQPFLRSRQD